MKFPEIQPGLKKFSGILFIVLITYVNIITICHYIAWVPIRKITSIFYEAGSKYEGQVLSSTRHLANQTGVIILVLLIIGIIMTVFNRKYIWYLMAILLTLFLSIYLGTEVTHLPN